MRTSLLLLLAACSSDPDKQAPATPDDDGSEVPDDTGPVDDHWVSPDVAERLEDGAVRAGIVADGAALFGGVSAEGREGDVKIYNSKVQFIIQGVRPGDYYEAYGGGVIDADIVRPEGQPGRDLVDELWVMVGLGRVVDPTEVTVLNDGTNGEPAVVRVAGKGAPMTLLTGALETPEFVEDLDVDIVTDYTLRPDSHLLQATTTVTWNDVESSVQLGDVSMVGMEVGATVFAGRGLTGGAGADTGTYVSIAGNNNEVVFGIFSDEAPFTSSAVTTLLEEVGPVMAGFGPSERPTAGTVLTHSRSIGVGPDLATLTDAWHADRGHSTTTVGGTVTAGGSPVAGARVHLRDGDSLETVAFTDEDGAWSAQVEASAPTAIATGRGPANIMDLPSGAGWVAPYAHEVPAATARDSLAAGALAVPFAEGFGVSAPVSATDSTDLTLTAPGTLAVTIADGGPAVVRVDFAAGDPADAGSGLVPGRPSGAAAWGYVRDGALDLPLEPGDYVVTVHRGTRFEPVVAELAVESGVATPLEAALVPAFDHPGMLAADPHSHAAPSGDGQIAMAHRLMVHAANGVQVHFGTDHDHVADYRPMLAPLGLDGVLASVMADEVSPVLRGHTNVYPIDFDASLPNGGAPRWWDGIETTDLWYQTIRARIGDDAILQVNHPDGSSGMMGLASYNPETGVVNTPDKFSDRFDAMEVLNDGEWEDFVPFYLDLTRRGYRVTPNGVSDAHGYRNGVGENMTWVPAGTDDIASFDQDALIDTMKANHTVASRGPLLLVTVDGEWAPGTAQEGAVSLEIDVKAASFVEVDTIELWKDGALDRTLPWTGERLEVPLEDEEDAAWVVIATGSTPMRPVYTSTPWALAAAVLHDVGADGWEAPLPPLTLD